VLLITGCANLEEPAFEYLFHRDGKRIVATWEGYYFLNHDGTITPAKETRDRKWIIDEDRLK
jgi:hypothetical protein